MEREKRGPPASAAPSPFTAIIRLSPLPRVFRHNPDLLFNGEVDPAEYLIQFNTEMEVYQVPEMTRCRLFTASLRGSAQQWFSKLGLASIRTWRQLEDLFVRQFQSTLHYSTPVATLANIKQREGEPLAEYFRRFNAEFPKKSIKELKISESYRDKRDRSSSPNERRKTYRRSLSPKKSVRGKETAKDSGRPYTSKWQTHTPLVASIDHIYATYAGKGVFRKAAPLTDYNKRDTSKYCAYHEATGHDTADCRQLKDEIETLIRQGKLTEWVVKEVLKHMTDYHTVPPPPPEDKERVPRAGSIHIILGGSHIGGDNRKALDRYAREAKDKPLTNVNHLSQRLQELFEREADDIVFKENDAKWVHYPHTDALVIKMKIETVNVHRAMVDTGSSTDVLTYDAYKKLGLLDRELTSTGGHLYGFTGNSIGVKGTIRLPVTIGEEPHVATQIAMFTVVDQPCAYNVIVGRPLMRAIRMVTSIHHMTIKFPTPTGVGFLKSCQYESRVCYNQALRAAESGSASKEMVEPGEGDVLMEEAEGRKRVHPEGHETCNLISIKELPENYFEHMGIQVEPRPGALLMEASQPIMLIQEGIVEEASDEEESPEQIAARLRKGK
ncbi:uncharacterized protein LOC141696399 [Apium graveolens]|uniref:uncharacterized protein LOC141696399 n=1 Tax=Apium graveolens TaxID=4045 RepID=UPI003D7B0186